MKPKSSLPFVLILLFLSLSAAAQKKRPDNLKAFKGYLDKKGNEYFSGKQEKDEYDFSH